MFSWLISDMIVINFWTICSSVSWVNKDEHFSPFKLIPWLLMMISPSDDRFEEIDFESELSIIWKRCVFLFIWLLLLFIDSFWSSSCTSKAMFFIYYSIVTLFGLWILLYFKFLLLGSFWFIITLFFALDSARSATAVP